MKQMLLYIGENSFGMVGNKKVTLVHKVTEFYTKKWHHWRDAQILNAESHHLVEVKPRRHINDGHRMQEDKWHGAEDKSNACSNTQTERCGVFM